MSWDWTPQTRAALQKFLEANGILYGPVTTRAIGDGHSNLTFLVSDGERDVVVRRPPPPPLPPGAHDMIREATLLRALHGTSVPVPEVLAVAEEGEVIDVPFYVMTYTRGPVVTDSVPAPLDVPDQCRSIGLALVDTLADLHAVDWRAVGLERMGRPEGFNRRHLERLRRLVADEDGRPPVAFAEVDAWLESNVPEESGATLVHCDFRIGNVILAPDAPGRVAAVLDWELATIGDPLLDVGYLLATIPEPGRAPNPAAELGAAMLKEGFPSRSELIDRYAERSGLPLPNLDWYTTLALWKLAVLYEYSRRRVEQGIGDRYYSDPGLVDRFLADARLSAGLET